MFHHWPIFSSQASQQPETDLGFPCLSNKSWSEAITAQVIGSENLSGTQAKAAASRPYAPVEQLPLRWMRLLDSSPGLLELLENQPTSGLQLSLHIKPDTRMCLNIRKMSHITFNQSEQYLWCAVQHLESLTDKERRRSVTWACVLTACRFAHAEKLVCISHHKAAESNLHRH